MSAEIDRNRFVETLNRTAEGIRDRGIAGWGNAVAFAAELIEQDTQALDAKDKRIAELEAALDGALDTILEHTLADSRPVTEEDQPAIDAFDRAVEEGRARLASRLLNKEDRNGDR